MVVGERSRKGHTVQHTTLELRYHTSPISPLLNNVFALRNDAGIVCYIFILRLWGCPGLPEIKFGGWPNGEVKVHPPSLPPSQPSRSSSCPCHHDSCTLSNEATTCTHWHAGTYRHAHMHKLTHALNAQAHVHMHACTTHANTHQHTHSHTQTHINTNTQVNKHCICAHTHILTHILTHTCKRWANSPPGLVRE